MTTVPYGTRSSAAAILQDLADRRPLPISALVHLTRHCNLSCVHCFQVDRGGRELTAAQWEVVFRRLADAGVLFMTFTGGEPALRDDFLDLVRLARSMHFALKIKTNGLRLDQAACDALSAAAVLEVQFSLYSTDPDVHDRVTGLAGSHAGTLAAARRLRANGTSVLLACPLMAETFDGYERVIELAAAEGMNYLFDPGIRIREDGCEDPAAMRLSEDHLERLLSDDRVFARDAAAPLRARPLDAPVCNVGKAAATVAQDGDVWPCLRLPVSLGNLLDEPLDRIWIGSPVLAGYRLCWGDLPVCRSCDLRPHCIRCHAEALREDGDLRGPSRLACRLARVRARRAADGGRRAADGLRRSHPKSEIRNPKSEIRNPNAVLAQSSGSDMLTHGLGEARR